MRKQKHLAAKPTEVELEILEVLWEIGPSPMGKVHEACLASRPSAPGYTTTQKDDSGDAGQGTRCGR